MSANVARRDAGAGLDRCALSAWEDKSSPPMGAALSEAENGVQRQLDA
jgi:hypothetical protein